MKDLLSILIGIVIVLVLTFLIKVDMDKRIEKIQNENKVLELRCDSIENQNDSIKFEMDRYSIRIDSLKNVDQKLSKDYIDNQNQLKIIKDKYEKSKRIDNFTTPDIFKYFTDSL